MRNPLRGTMAPLMSQNCTRLANCIEGGSMKLTTLVDYMYVSYESQMHFCVMNVFFFN